MLIFNSFLLIILSIILILTLGSVIGMIIHRNLFIKFFLCFESFFFIISVIILIWSCSINGIIIILYLLWNSTFEVILGLTISLYLLIISSPLRGVIITTNQAFKGFSIIIPKIDYQFSFLFSLYFLSFNLYYHYHS